MEQHDGQTDFPQKLYSYVEESLTKKESFHFLGFERLQRLNIVQLQYKLAEIKVSAKKDSRYPVDEVQAKLLKETLVDYAAAIQNYNYFHNMDPLPFDDMVKRNLRLVREFRPFSNKSEAPFGSHYFYAVSNRPTVDPVRDWLRQTLPRSLTYSPEERQARQNEFEASQPALQISDFVDRLARFIAALIGRFFLIVPMVIMVLNQSRTKSLITVSVAVLLFSAALAFGLKANNVETLVSTATYAAVLVVFVGTSI